MTFYNRTDIINELYYINQDPLFNSWFDIVEDILLNEEFQKRRLFKHHEDSVWKHSILVSFKSYKYSTRFNTDNKVCAIAGLLHDFYPYAWQYSKELDDFDPTYLEQLYIKKKLLKKHGFTHALESYNNYLIYFKEYEDKKVSNSIKRHMFPLNIVPPRYKEGWIITFADKRESISDMKLKHIFNYLGMKKGL